MADDLKASNKKVRALSNKLVRVIDEFFDAKLENALKRAAMDDEEKVEPQQAEEEENTPVKKTKKTEEEAPAGPVECDGNIMTGAKCPIPIAERKKAKDTKGVNGDKKVHPTCTKCKSIISAARKAKRIAEAAAAPPTTPAAAAAPAVEESSEPVECDGNILLETRCPIPIANRKKAKDTTEAGTTFATCTHCKRAIAKTRSEQRVDAE